MEYHHEHLWAGELGNLFVIASFCFALLSSIGYFLSARTEGSNEASGWLRLGRIGFYGHSLSVLGIVAVLFIMLFNHYFEYHYVWQHSNRSMDMKYIASCFWEGQEGSFLLWSFWHVVVGLILMRSSRDWEAPVMSILSMVQIFLSSMLLGVYILDYKLGSNPFTVLLREHPDFKNLPFVQNSDYLDKLDGRGLNPLLQNYWMVIHPPTLFLGFALTVIPFAYAIVGLWKKKYNEWQRFALPWTFFGITVLGTGILMGGAWAYESLSFGGFWAWDPVENASLVPWLILVGAGHVMMIHKNKGQSLFATFFLSILSFILVLYSTFLTRSGILGDASVHAFTDLGMSGQLLLYLLFFTFLGLALLAWRYKVLPRHASEESMYSREFWMMIGAMVFLISSFQITFQTSLPVINKIFGTNYAIPSQDSAPEVYHPWQISFGILIMLLMGMTQFFKYKHTDPAHLKKHLLIPGLLSLTVTIAAGIGFGWFNSGKTIFYLALFFSCTFAAIANAGFFFSILKGKLDSAGASVAHVGFGMLIAGALLSTGLSENISINRKGDVEVFGKNFSNRDNILLVRNDTVPMGDYYVVYTGKRKEGINLYYDVAYFERTPDGILKPAFTLSPFLQLNERMGNVAEPDTRHFLLSDIYTHITYADLETSENIQSGEFKEPHNNTVAKGDTFFTSNSIVVLEGLVTNLDLEKLNIPKADIAVGARLKVFDVYGKVMETMPVYYITDSIPGVVETNIEELGLKFAFWQIDPASGKVDISVMEKKSDKKDFIVMKAIVFPWINLLWTGCLVMIIGTFMAIRKRIRTQF